MASYINPKIIIWARKRSGLSINDLANKMRRDPGEIRKWESGTKVPSYTCLEELAYRHFKIPLAVFFFPEPPDIEDPRNKFRRLPEFELARLSSDTLQMIRLAQAYQESLAELMLHSQPRRRISHDLNSKGTNPRQFAQKTRKYLGITIQNQFDFQSCEQALKAWRHALEEAGVFTFKDSLKDRFISGFCLLDNQFPIIFLNNSNAFARQIFTLAHELGHILFGVHGITDVDESYLRFMSSRDKSLEIRCNQFAAELLVPEEAFREEIPLFNTAGSEIIPDIADKYSVSREVILRRFLDHGLVTDNYYETKALEWNRDYLRSGRRATGGNYYLTKLSYLGEGFTRLAFENYCRGRLTKAQLATHLNINARNIAKLEKYMGW